MSGNFYINGAAAMTSLDDTWTTPRDRYAEWHQEFNFSLDAAALSNSALCEQWYGPDNPDPDKRDAFTTDWLKDSDNGTVWLNPPYGRSIGKWMELAHNWSVKGLTIVNLIPARTDTHWFHDYCINHEVRYLRGRLKFGDSKNCAPFPSAIVVMRNK